jgi:aryl-alcohol dehydrogenase-like predicted oxidoreductase
LGRLVKAGKVRAIGASPYPPARLESRSRRAGKLGVARYETLQPE